MPFFPTPSLLPPSPLSGCVRRSGRSGGTTTPAVIRDGPDGRTTKTHYGTASAAASAATEEEECNGCDGANPRRRLDDSLLCLADGILLRSIVATTAVGSTAIATMSMPVIEIGALFIEREDREGDDGSGVATEDDDDTDAEAGGYACLDRVFREEEDDNKDRDKQGQRARRSIETRSKFEMLCKGEPSSSSLSTARPKRPSLETTAARAGGVDPSQTKRSRMGQPQRRRRNGGCVGDHNDYKQLPYIQRRDDAHNSITCIKKHIMCLIFATNVAPRKPRNGTLFHGKST
jgi:hypothetical protein